MEIYRSHAPADVELGLGGAILFEPKRLRKNELGLGVQAGSYGTRGAHTYGSFGDSERWLLAGIEVSAADNDYEYFDDRGTLFDDDDGGNARLKNADAQQTSFWLLGGTRTDGVEIELLAHHADREQGAPKLALVPSESARVRSSRELFALSSKLPVEAWQGTLRLSTTATTSTTSIDDPQAELGLLRPYVETPGERLEQRIQAVQNHDSGLRTGQEVSLTTERLRRLEREGGTLVEKIFARRFGVRPAISAELPLGGGLSVNGTAAARRYDAAVGRSKRARSSRPKGVSVRPSTPASAAFTRTLAATIACRRSVSCTAPPARPRQRCPLPNRAKAPSSALALRLAPRGEPTLWLDLSAFARRSRSSSPTCAPRRCT